MICCKFPCGVSSASIASSCGVSSYCPSVSRSNMWIALCGRSMIRQSNQASRAVETSIFARRSVGRETPSANAISRSLNFSRNWAKIGWNSALMRFFVAGNGTDTRETWFHTCFLSNFGCSILASEAKKRNFINKMTYFCL